MNHGSLILNWLVADWRWKAWQISRANCSWKCGRPKGSGSLSLPLRQQKAETRDLRWNPLHGNLYIHTRPLRVACTLWSTSTRPWYVRTLGHKLKFPLCLNTDQRLTVHYVSNQTVQLNAVR